MVSTIMAVTVIMTLLPAVVVVIMSLRKPTLSAIKPSSNTVSFVLKTVGQTIFAVSSRPVCIGIEMPHLAFVFAFKSVVTMISSVVQASFNSITSIVKICVVMTLGMITGKSGNCSDHDGQ